MAALVAVVPTALDPPAWQHWTYLSLVLLVTACPCALVISTPVTSVCGLSRAAQQVGRSVGWMDGGAGGTMDGRTDGALTSGSRIGRGERVWGEAGSGGPR